MVASPVRVPRLAMRPAPVEFAKAVWSYASGAGGRDLLRRVGRGAGSRESVELDAMTFAPLGLRETGEVYLFDEWGLCLAAGSNEPWLAVSWAEIDKASLQVQSSQLLGLKMLRLVFWPLQPQIFRTAHPECARLWEPSREGYALAIVTAREVPQSSIDQMMAALAHAGTRYDGRVDHLVTSG